MDPTELNKLSKDPEEASPTDIVDKFLFKNLPPSGNAQKHIVIKPKAKKEEKEQTTQEFAKKASEMEQDHIDDIKSALSPVSVTGGFSVSKVIESIAQKEIKPSEDNKLHITENNM